MSGEELVLQAHSHTPLEVRHGGGETQHMLGRRWVAVGLELHDALAEAVGGEDRVWETYMMPFTSQVVCLVQVVGGEARTIDPSAREQPLLTTKQLGEEGGWVAFYPDLGHLSTAAMARHGGPAVVGRLLAKVGVRGVQVPVHHWMEEELDGEEEVDWWTRVDRGANVRFMKEALGCLGWIEEQE